MSLISTDGNINYMKNNPVAKNSFLIIQCSSFYKVGINKLTYPLQTLYYLYYINTWLASGNC